MKHSAFVIMAIVLFCAGCSALKADAQEVERERYRGILIVQIADNFEQQVAKTHYDLISDEDGKRLPLKFLNQDDIPNVKSGTHIEIIGRQQNGFINVKTVRVLEQPE